MNCENGEVPRRLKRLFRKGRGRKGEESPPPKLKRRGRPKGPDQSGFGRRQQRARNSR